MALTPDQQRELDAQEELRYAVRRYLVGRPLAAVGLEVIRHGLMVKGVDATDTAIETELAYWEGLAPPQVLRRRATHGTSKAWQITSAGRLAHDNGE